MTGISMASRLISFLLLTFALCILPLFAQGINCPKGSSLVNDITTFTISTTQQKLLPLLGDFYSPDWQKTFFNVKITTSPPHRILDYSSFKLEETLISGPELSKPLGNGFDLNWELTSDPFTLPSLSDEKVMYYKQTIKVQPVCPRSTYSTVTWSTNACVSSDKPIQWFTVQHRMAAEMIFARIARGWFGGISDDPEGNNCNHFDTRIYALPTVSITSSPPKPSTVVGGDALNLDDKPLPTATETWSTSYVGILGPGTTLSWPAGGTPTAIMRPVANAVSTSTVSVVNYSSMAGAVKGGALSRVLGLALGGLAVLIVR